MPITHIHKVTQTINLAVEYGKADKVEKDADISNIENTISYAKNDKTGEVTFHTLSSYQNSRSNGLSFSEECQELLAKFPRKREVREGEQPALLYHLVQSFDGYIPPTLANQIGMELAEQYLGNYLVQVSTHTNTENIHNHIIFCAVDLDGNRYNDCDETKNELRQVSDAISEKYGLEILENTREYKPIHWTDKNGNRHSFEPTPRKREMIEKRKNGEISTDDVSSYRNFEQYEQDQLKKKTQKDIIADDICNCLPLANSYEHLLALMRENLGYKIKDKKKNGDYLEHIVFTSPQFEKSVRDSSLDKDGYFTRENLERVIAEIQKGKQIENADNIQTKGKDDYSDVSYFSDYSYDKFDLSDIDDERRAWKKENGSIVILRRGEPERAVITSARNIESSSISKLNTFGYENWKADYILHHSYDAETKARFNMSDEHLSYAQMRAKAIQERLNCLQFIEEYNLFDYRKVVSIMDSLWKQYNSSFEKLNEIGSRLDKMRFISELPKTVVSLEKRIVERSTDSNYRANEMDNDRILLKKYKAYLSKNGLDKDPTKITKLQVDLTSWETKYANLSLVLKEKKKKLNQYERSIEILQESIGGSKEELRSTWKDYSDVQAKEKEEESKNQRIRNSQSSNNKMDR